MDLEKAIAELQEEKRRIDEAIQTLQAILAARSQGELQPPRKRGRKSMTPEERQEVAERMKKYWATRRTDRPKNAS